MGRFRDFRRRQRFLRRERTAISNTTRPLTVVWRTEFKQLTFAMTGGLLILLSYGLSAAEFSQLSNDWPCWRGPTANNHSRDTSAPVRWSKEDGIIWTAPVPGRGHASPCICRDKVFIASADESTQVQFLICFDRRTGAQLWRTDLHRGSLPLIHAKNSHASATPACDGNLVFQAFVNADQLWISALNTRGHIVWQQSLGPYKHPEGLGASPVLYDNLIIVAKDSETEPALTALRCSDGRVIWRAVRPASDNAATPIVGVVAGRAQLLINGANAVSSSNPATGSEYWRVNHNTRAAACTMAFDGQRVYASGDVPEPTMMSIQGDGNGDVTDTHVLWQTRQSITRVPSPLVVGEQLFVVTDSGAAVCRNAKTGRVLWKHRLGGNFCASPVLAAGNVYATNEDGATYIFRAAEKFELIAKNELDESCMATLAICGGQVYLRTSERLYCIGGDERN